MAFIFIELVSISEIEPERQHVVSSLSEVDDARPKLVRNYDITPLRSDPVSPVQQKVIISLSLSNIQLISVFILCSD